MLSGGTAVCLPARDTSDGKVGVSGPTGAAMGGRGISALVSLKATPHVDISARAETEIVRAAFPTDCRMVLLEFLIFKSEYFTLESEAEPLCVRIKGRSFISF